jgi:hypothetical protein
MQVDPDAMWVAYSDGARLAGTLATRQSCRMRSFMGLPVLVLGCSEGRRITVSDDAGELVVRSTLDGALAVEVSFPGCFSSSCSEVMDARCTITLGGDALRVSSHSEVDITTAHGTECSQDCMAVTAGCITSTFVEAGEYNISHGLQEARVTLPVECELFFGPGGDRPCR